MPGIPFWSTAGRPLGSPVPDGHPLIFLNDDPTTGGYPVIAVVAPHDLASCVQTCLGTAVRLRCCPVSAAEPSWTAVLDAVRLGPADDAVPVTADQFRAVVGRLIAARYWHEGDTDILIVMDAGYDVTRLAFVLADLLVELLGRIRSDRVLRLPKPVLLQNSSRPG